MGLPTNQMVGERYYSALDPSAGKQESSYGCNLVPGFGWAVERNRLFNLQANSGFAETKNGLQLTE